MVHISTTIPALLHVQILYMDTTIPVLIYVLKQRILIQLSSSASAVLLTAKSVLIQQFV